MCYVLLILGTTIWLVGGGWEVVQPICTYHNTSLRKRANRNMLYPILTNVTLERREARAHVLIFDY